MMLPMERAEVFKILADIFRQDDIKGEMILHLTESDGTSLGIALLIVFAILLTSYCIARSISELNDDDPFTWR